MLLCACPYILVSVQHLEVVSTPSLYLSPAVIVSYEGATFGSTRTLQVSSSQSRESSAGHSLVKIEKALRYKVFWLCLQVYFSALKTLPLASTVLSLYILIADD